MNSNLPLKSDLKYFTPAEAATILRVDIRTVYSWLRSGKLPAVKFGKLWRIEELSLGLAREVRD